MTSQRLATACNVLHCFGLHSSTSVVALLHKIGVRGENVLQMSYFLYETDIDALSLAFILCLVYV